MAHRMFSDASGREWLVWDVVPVPAGHRDEGPRNIEVAVEPEAEPARTLAHLPGAFATGWLCFESGDEKRRLAPIPPAWERADKRQLVDLVERATPVAGRGSRFDTGRMRALNRPEPADRPRDPDTAG